MKLIIRGFLFQVSGMLLIIVLISSCSCNTVPEVSIVEVTYGGEIGPYNSWATLSGKILDEGVGSCNCSNSGFCWSESHLPTRDDNEVSTEISETGSFTISFECNELECLEYYVRAWAINEHGVSYSNEVMISLGSSPSDGPGTGID